MKFGACKSQLYDAQKTARAKWDTTAEVWADTTREEFAEQTWELLDRQVADVLRAIDQLTAIFADVRSQCEYDPYQ